MNREKANTSHLSSAVNLFLLAAGILVLMSLSAPSAVAEPLPGGTQDPTTIPKYVDPLIIPPEMPYKDILKMKGGKKVTYYEIEMVQFWQNILPIGPNPQNPLFPKTKVWSYGAVGQPWTRNYPAFTIEASFKKETRVKWVNGLVDASGNYLLHLLPVDQTLHWANPPGPTDMHGMDPSPYTGPVPMVTHVHGAHTYDDSDGYTEAWYLPAANNIPAGYATVGSYYNTFKNQYQAREGVTWQPGTAVFEYPNEQRATTLWYHDHALGMTRLNVYAGPAGFYLLRGGMDDIDLGYRYPKLGDKGNVLYTEIPIAIQDRSFNADGSLFYTNNRAFFEGLNKYDPENPVSPYLDIPFIPDQACDGQQSDISPIWNPEFFGNTMVVNGRTWPVLNVEARRYRLRLLDGTQGRFLILKLAQDNTPGDGINDGDWTALNGMFWQIGAEGGFLPAPVQLDELLMAPAERADVIVDFTAFAPGTELYLVNIGPDEPYGGGIPGVDFDPADSSTTGQVMKFVVTAPTTLDQTIPPAQLILPAFTPLGPEVTVRKLSLNEEDSETVRVIEDEDGNLVLECEDPAAEPFGPKAALLGTVQFDMSGVPSGVSLKWMDAVTENPALGDTEIWEMYNFTMDAHPIHIHQVQFEVVNREIFEGDGAGTVRPPEAWETGYKDTVIAYPGEITRVKAKFDIPGLFVWHCHIVEHEDNEMMRPFCVGTCP